ncbi:MAG: f1pep1 2 [Caulobacter sp.]|nr:f1pep1 2 [Caulobacter sp.]
MRPTRRFVALGLAAAPLVPALARATEPARVLRPPVAAVEPVVDDYFGTRITDNYRWMEDRTGPRFVAWAKGESAYARQELDAIPGRDDLQKRIAAHTGGGASVTGTKLAGGRVFYMKRNPGENSYRLYVRQGVGGPERVLVDPDKIPTDGPHYAIDYFAPSPDGSKIAVGLSPGGSENSVIHVLDVATGVYAPDKIDRCESGFPSWLPDGSGFFYNRYVLLGAGAVETDKYQNSRALLHRLGTNPEQDLALIGTGVAGSPAVTPVDQPFVIANVASPWAFAVISHGADPDQTFYAAPLSDAVAGRAAWRLIADVADKVSNIAAHADRAFLLSHKDAPRYQVLETTLSNPDAAHAKVVIAHGPRVIQDMSLSAEALYTHDLDGGLGRVRRFDLASGKLEELPLPLEGAVGGPLTDEGAPDALVGLQNWVVAPTVYTTRGLTVTPTSLIPPWSDDLSAYEAHEVMATAADGTKIPLSIVHKKGFKPDGTAPVWLTGYGAYGIALAPALASRFFTLLDDGGVYAVAHVRGGGEFGEDWHLAGKQATKPNTYKDLIACAEYLVANRYGAPGTLAIEGRSAGGITVGMAMTQRPDLFRVVFCGVGDCNTLRCENGTDGPANALEYGSVATKAGFEALLAVDSTQHVKAGVKYPAALFTSGMNDPRVAPWQPGKMAAHVQAASASGRPVLYLVDFDAGHGMGSTKSQRDRELADQLAFLYWQMGKKGYQPKT